MTSLITFPCSFPIKVMGLNSEAFISAVMAILHHHLEPGRFTQSAKPSSSGTYLSLTVTFTAQSQEQLNAIYEELNRHELVVMTL
jgi:putative lipoic acid-binding regulatory protein